MKSKQVLHTTTVTQTECVGAELAEQMCRDTSLPPFVALYGDLGVGKTAFIRGFTSVIAPAAIVRSPTFALVNEYRAKPRALFHFDMYRIENEDDLYSIGFYDYLERNGICLVEWSEKIPYAIPDELIRVTIQKDDPAQPDSRMISIEIVREEQA